MPAIKKFTVLVIVLPIALLLLSAGTVAWMFSLQPNLQTVCSVHIPRGTTNVGAVTRAAQSCNAPQPWLLQFTARVLGLFSTASVKSGWYRFYPGITQLDLLQMLYSGSGRPTVRVLLREGLTRWQTAGTLARALDIDSAKLAARFDSLEGYLFPDTYVFLWREDPNAIALRLQQQYRKVTGNNPPSYEQLILASIVQAEASLPAEMPRIAGVYVNRLNKGMRLEADPTVVYGKHHQGRITYWHLRDRHAWNTYTNTGLPPTPICNPGADAIKAAMNPEKHEYLFFVVKPGGQGAHAFAKTFAGHNANVRDYRTARAQQQKKQ